MPAENKTKKVEKEVELEVLVDGHSHNGNPCKKGDKIMVPETVKSMLGDAWKVSESKKEGE